MSDEEKIVPQLIDMSIKHLQDMETNRYVGFYAKYLREKIQAEADTLNFAHMLVMGIRIRELERQVEQIENNELSENEIIEIAGKHAIMMKIEQEHLTEEDLLKEFGSKKEDRETQKE